MYFLRNDYIEKNAIFAVGIIDLVKTIELRVRKPNNGKGKDNKIEVIIPSFIAITPQFLSVCV
jgi:hypothetical protein